MINAVILLNDDIDHVSECSPDTGKSTHSHRSNLFFLLSVSIPRPLFPSKMLVELFIVAGYPMIYHHVKKLSEIE